jgi:MFS family permease
MVQELTQSQQSISRKYIAYRFLTSLYFVTAVWLFFYRIFITDQQVGIVDALAFAVGLFAEVPSGVLADRFGRAKMVKIGLFLTAIGMFTQIFGGFALLFIGQAIVMVGVAFVSGADEALFFEKLKFDAASSHWRKLVTKCSQASLVGGLLATFLGGWLHMIDPRLPWALTGSAFIVAALTVLSMKDSREMKSRNKIGTELREYLSSIGSGFAQFATPKLLLYVPIILVVEGLFYTTDWGLLRVLLLNRFYFDPFWSATVVSISGLITVLLLGLIHKHADSFSEKHIITSVSLIAAASLLCSLFDIGHWGFLVIFALYAGDHILRPFMSEILNNHAEEKQRATVLSVASFLRTLPYVVLAPVIGYLSTRGNLDYFLIVWAFITCSAVIFYLALKKKDSRISLTEDIDIL